MAVGASCQAPYEGDGEYYSATVLGVLGGGVSVSFDDFDGETAVVAAAALRGLPAAVSAAGAGWAPCRFGDGCTRPGCRFTHPRDSGGTGSAASAASPRGAGAGAGGGDDSGGMVWVRSDGPYGDGTPARRPAPVARPAAVAPPRLPAVGSTVDAKYPDDGQWYRATLDKVQGQDVWVSFVEYDNESAVVEPSAVRALRHAPVAAEPPRRQPPPPQQPQHHQRNSAAAARSKGATKGSVLDRLGVPKGETRAVAAEKSPVMSRLGAKPSAKEKRKPPPPAAAKSAAKKARTAPPAAAAPAVQRKKPAAARQPAAVAAAAARKAAPAAIGAAEPPADASPMLRLLIKRETAGNLTAGQKAQLQKLRSDSTAGGGAKQPRPAAPLELRVEPGGGPLSDSKTPVHTPNTAAIMQQAEQLLQQQEDNAPAEAAGTQEAATIEEGESTVRALCSAQTI